MKKLREHAMEIINFGNKKTMPQQIKSTNNMLFKNTAALCRKKIKEEDDDDKKQC